MKKIFTLVFLLGLALLTRAKADEGAIGITNLSRQQIVIEVDGKEYKDCEQTLTIRDLSPGFHMVKVYGEDRRSSNSIRPKLYNNHVHVKAGYFVDIVINRFGRVFTDEQQMNGRWHFDDDHYGPQAMNEKIFLSFMQQLGKENFDNSKMTLVKEVAGQNWFTAEQAKEVARSFSFESNKLEMAQLLYGRTVDKEHYFIMNDIFDFSTTKDKLADFIKNYK